MSKYDIIVLGSGPGGYVTAIRASQLGFKTAVIEKENLGGVCLNWGCIPTKALLKSAEVFNYLNHAEDYGLKADNVDKDFDAVIKRSRDVAGGMSKGVQFLMKKNKIDVIDGFGKLKSGKKVAVKDSDGNTKDYEADHIIVATGAKSRVLPNLPQDGEKVIGYREAMNLKKQPKKMIVVGSGAIGVEFAHFYNSMGTEVTIVEYLPNLVPLEDEEVSKQFEKSFKKSGIKVMTNSAVESVDTSGDGVKAKVKTKKGEETLEADVVLSAVGIKTNIENIGLEEIGISTENGFISINEYNQSSIPSIYAIGDVTGPPWLAHVASAQGHVAVEHAAGNEIKPIDYSNIPNCTYCQPQVASLGLTEAVAREKSDNIKVGRFDFRASGKAMATGDITGFVKLVFD
ncbi:dihydrolipoyl dehydrogenase, partial [Mesonia mobilis]|uniref:dihydrolipoyl dehydrogenase n=1 Tax=Mesonia mobilis TaxID=369791 RepID=UPI0026EC9F40